MENNDLRPSPMAECESPSSDFTMTANGIPVPVHEVRVSQIPFNCWWPGHQRPLDQTELASYCSFDFSGSVTIEIISAHPIERLDVRPAEYGITPSVNGRKITFLLDRPRHFTVEVNGFHKALHVFANPPEQYEVDPSDPDTLYFGPGVHHADLILPKSNQTVYIDAGAVVFGSILIYKADHVRILGRGVLDSGKYKRAEEAKLGEPGGELLDGCAAAGIDQAYARWTGNICAVESRDLLIDGIILRDPPFWSMNIREKCENVVIRNLKLIGLWRYNADGIDICDCKHVLIEDCFIRSFDDSVITRGSNYNDREDGVFDMVTKDCVLWCEWGRAMEIWTCRGKSRISNIVYRDCHIIHCAHIAMDLQVYNGGPTVMEYILFENITLDTDYPNDRPCYQENDGQVYHKRSDDDYTPDLFHADTTYELEAPVNQLGLPCDIVFRDILVKNIRITAKRHVPGSSIHAVKNYVKADRIQFEDILVNGKKMRSFQEFNVKISPDAGEITLS